jgi:hypothetical protein
MTTQLEARQTETREAEPFHADARRWQAVLSRDPAAEG